MKSIKYFVCSGMMTVTLSQAGAGILLTNFKPGKQMIVIFTQMAAFRTKPGTGKCFLQCESLHQKSCAIYHLFIFSLGKSREGEKLVQAGDYYVLEKLVWGKDETFQN